MKLVLQCAMCGTHHPVGTRACTTCRATGVPQLRLMLECPYCWGLGIDPRCAVCPAGQGALEGELILAEEVTDEPLALDGADYDVVLDLDDRDEDEKFVLDLTDEDSETDDEGDELDSAFDDSEDEEEFGRGAKWELVDDREDASELEFCLEDDGEADEDEDGSDD